MAEKKNVRIPDDLEVGQPPDGTPPETVDQLRLMEARIMKKMKEQGIKIRDGGSRP